MKQTRLQKWILVALLALHASFYISAISTNHFQVFYPWGIIHQGPYRYIDYFQIPNGAQSLAENGSPIGNPTNVVVNQNVYHPLTTAVVGFPLRHLPPETGFIAYTLFKLLATCVLGFWLFRRYRNHSQFFPAACVFLGFFAQVVEIGIGQYHFLLTLTTYALLLTPRNDYLKLGAFYLLGLLVKPIGLLWTPYFLAQNAKRAWLLGAGAFALITWHSYSYGWGVFFTNNLLNRASTPLETFLMTPTLEGVLRTGGLSPMTWLSVKGALAGALITFQLLCSPSLIVGLLQWVSYTLLCYSMTFDYHYTLLVPFFVLGFLKEPLFAHRAVKWPIFISALPSPFVLISHIPILFTVNEKGHHIATALGSILIEGFRITPLIVLNIGLGWLIAKERGLRNLSEVPVFKEINHEPSSTTELKSDDQTDRTARSKSVS